MLAYYYWNPSFQQPQPQFNPQMQTPPVSVPSGATMTPTGSTFPGGAAQREESYIENILRLNLGKPGTFYFTIPGATGENIRGNTRIVRGAVLQAGRDHVVIREQQTNHDFLFPMIYFDFAEFEEPLTYLNNSSSRRR